MRLQVPKRSPTYGARAIGLKSNVFSRNQRSDQMAVTFELIEDRNVKRMLTDIIDQFHPELAEVQATFLLQLAIAPPDKKTGEIPPAIKLHGSPKLATVKVVNLKDRVAGLPDARLLIDKHRWDEHTT